MSQADYSHQPQPRLLVPVYSSQHQITHVLHQVMHARNSNDSSTKVDEEDDDEHNPENDLDGAVSDEDMLMDLHRPPTHVFDPNDPYDPTCFYEQDVVNRINAEDINMANPLGWDDHTPSPSFDDRPHGTCVTYFPMLNQHAISRN